MSTKTLRNRRRRQRLREKRLNPVSSGYVQNIAPNATRTGVPNNPADPRTNKALAQMGSTAAGRLAALKILHPNGETDTYVTKIPDGKATTSVVLERRDEFEISNPLPITAPLLTWNCIVFDLPFLIGTQIVIRWDGSESPTPDTLGLAIETILIKPSRGAARYPAFQTLVTPTTPAFTYEWSVLIASTLSPSYVTETTGSPLGPCADIKSIRRTYYGSTIDYDAASLTDEGRVVAGQWNPDVANRVTNIVDGVAGSDTINTYVYQIPAYTNSTVVSSDEACYQGLSKCGLYLPLRPNGMEIAFTPTQDWRQVFAQKLDVDPNTTLLVANVTSDGLDLHLQGWLIGVSVWVNIHPTTILRIKRKEGIELVSTPTGAYAPFATPALPNDLRAMQIIQEFSRTEPHAYIADYNELGTMLKKIVSGIGNAIGSLGLPVISPLGSKLHQLTEAPMVNELVGLLDSVL